ncbi:Uncharacterized protein OBRU01_12272 [Operophtera brumata]|uniref:Uncharacterized protein n=1 Tax=Operophtera brumata TaxID=104452 RepID=A0A0L7LBJ6_OPEBR|nr:Uncharacterized protein OBRU01_12272 [Operophtera brumata]
MKPQLGTTSSYQQASSRTFPRKNRWSGGVILGGSTLWSLLRMSYYFWTTDLGIDLGSSVLFMAGALLCLPACWLATIVPYHRKSISLLAAYETIYT